VKILRGKFRFSGFMQAPNPKNALTRCPEIPHAMPVMYKILPKAEWDAFVASGTFKGSPVDLQDGYIHFSYGHQAEETARKYFSGQHDLMIFAVEAETLGSCLKNEPSRGGDLFPHLYAPLAISAVLWSKQLPLSPDGVPVLPSLDEV
jgi:uncharacterized protein (DUF952 family)